MPQIDEFQVHRAICIMVRAHVRLDVVWWHTPNGGTRRDGHEGKRLKEMGVKSGIPDLFFLDRARLFGMEVKRPGGVQSDAQIETEGHLKAAGLAGYVVVDNIQAAKTWLFQMGLIILPPPC